MRPVNDTNEVVFQADFNERIFATPAVVGNNLYLRTETKLYAFGRQAASAIVHARGTAEKGSS